MLDFKSYFKNSKKIYLHEMIFLCLWLASARWSCLLIGRSWWHDLWWCEDVSNQFGLSQSISQRRLSPASASNITSYQAGMKRNWGNISYKNSSILLEWIPSSDAFNYYFREWKTINIVTWKWHDNDWWQTEYKIKTRHSCYSFFPELSILSYPVNNAVFSRSNCF